jgi:hypothetical protein
MLAQTWEASTMTPEQEMALEFHRNEMNLGPSQFERWAARVEKIVGHDLDGDQTEDGYSLDGASDAFDAGMSPAQYADTIR